MNISYSWGVPILYQECLYLFNKYNRLATDIKSESTSTVCNGISTITIKDSSKYCVIDWSIKFCFKTFIVKVTSFYEVFISIIICYRCAPI